MIDMSEKTKYEKMVDFYEKSTLDDNAFFEGLAKELDISFDAAIDIWYAEQRSWFKPEMVDELCRLDKVKGEFRPALYSGEFGWDEESKRFTPRNV